MSNSLLIWVTLLICLIVALLNVAAHWFPWVTIPGAADGAGRLRRVFAYAYGTATVFLGMVAVTLVWSLSGRLTVSPWTFLLILALMGKWPRHEIWCAACTSLKSTDSRSPHSIIALVYPRNMNGKPFGIKLIYSRQ